LEQFDIVVIGGGVNGCGIARDAAGRGFSVLLAEKGDLASGTSSASTKLIHGGLRYLEFYEFALVREALKEREVLWAMAPHIIWPLRFVLPETTIPGLPGCCGWGCFSTIILAGASGCRRPAAWIFEGM
jgi:glycerol-3-phosphate dehydrogenase